MDAYEGVRRICAALPEVDEVARPFSVKFKVRTRVVAEVFEWDGSPTMAVVWVDPEEREFLVRTGHPYFALRNTDKRVGVVLDGDTDWDEVAELVTESFRIVAPKQLIAQLDDQP